MNVDHVANSHTKVLWQASKHVLKLGVVMDPIHTIHYQKDSTLAMLFEAQKRGWDIYYLEQKDLFLQGGIAYADAKRFSLAPDQEHGFAISKAKTMLLAELDVVLMRKDPPFNEEYIYTTHLLEHAERQGTLVVNKPQSLRDFNEKLFAAYFPQCSPPTLVSRSIEKLDQFKKAHHDIVCKPLNSMGGNSVFRVQEDDANAAVIFETLTQKGTCYTMAQQFIPEIQSGDKRILMVNGGPVPFVLARVPQEGDWRGNLAVGAKGVVLPLTERDRWICDQVGPFLKARGIYSAGLDVIGDYLTEINITSPTCIREIDAGAGINVSAMLIDVIEALV
jgi:glutathione synthase